jgi:hypothetical protein
MNGVVKNLYLEFAIVNIESRTIYYCEMLN